MKEPKSPHKLEKEELAYIVAQLQECLYLELQDGPAGDQVLVWTLDKGVNGADLVDELNALLYEFGLTPQELER